MIVKLRTLVAAASLAAFVGTASAQALPVSWSADNGNGTFTNPLFYDEFSDPDVIRVGDDYYLAGTTMHCVPGLVILHSRDLVNWELCSYCFDSWDDILDDDRFRLKDGKEIYGQGVWAPVIRYNEGKFYVFTNVNGIGLQLFISSNPKGPWEHHNLGGHIYDLSVLFDNGKAYAIHGYDEVKVTEFKSDWSGYVEGSERVIIPKGSAMGEGHHAYKIDGKYYILSAEYSPMGRTQCARSNSLYGPYETTAISCVESLGTPKFPLITNVPRKLPGDGFKFNVAKPGDNELGCATVHQGGMLQLPNGEWWAVSMLDFEAVGRTVCLVPVTWHEGWPYFGLEGNLGRTPRTWFKPAVNDTTVVPHAPYQRSDDFNAKTLQQVWQWNHQPVKGKWALKNGRLRLNTLPAENFLWARNTLTQRCIGPVSVATVMLDGSHLKEGDVSGLAILNLPYQWVGLRKEGGKLKLQLMNQTAGLQDLAYDAVAQKGRVYLRIEGDYDLCKARFSYSVDGQEFTLVGDTLDLPYQLRTFQGSRYSLFAYNQQGHEGGYAEFDDFTVKEPMADRRANLPVGRVITLDNLANGTRMEALTRGIVHSAAPGSPQYNGAGCRFRVHDRGNGRVALEALNGMGFVTITGIGLSADVRLVREESEASLFMWQDMLRGECMLMSLKNHRYVGVSPDMGEPYSCDFAGSTPNRRNGCVFRFTVVE